MRTAQAGKANVNCHTVPRESMTWSLLLRVHTSISRKLFVMQWRIRRKLPLTLAELKTIANNVAP
jgi:hypothetical protein